MYNLICWVDLYPSSFRHIYDYVFSIKTYERSGFFNRSSRGLYNNWRPTFLPSTPHDDNGTVLGLSS